MPSGLIKGNSCISDITYHYTIYIHNEYGVGYRNKVLGFRVLKLRKA